MKRFLSVTAALLLLSALLSGCSKPPELQKDFSLPFTAENGDARYKGTAEKAGDTLTITLSEPYTVSGMSLCYSGSALSVSRGGHTTNAPSDYLPSDSMSGALYNALLYYDQAEYTETKDNVDTFTLPTSYGDAVLTAQSGIPRSLSEPHGGWEFRFDPS